MLGSNLQFYLHRIYKFETLKSRFALDYVLRLFFCFLFDLILLNTSYACEISINFSWAIFFSASPFTLSGWFSFDNLRKVDVISACVAVGSNPSVWKEKNKMLE